MANPEELRVRRARAEDHKKAGRTADAVAEYQALATAYAAIGQLPAAIGVCRSILAIAPDHHDTQDLLSRLFAAAEGAHPDHGAIELDGALAASLTTTSGAAPPPLPDDAVDDAIDLDALAAALTPLKSGSVRIERPAAVPLFSGLGPTTFLQLLARVDAWEAEKDAMVVVEGEASESVFVVARGKVRIERHDPAGGPPIVLARLGPGSFFGEMALLSRKPRAASVVAEERTELLEISREVLEQLVKVDANVAQALERFCRGRLVENLARTSKLFAFFPPELVKQTLDQFDVRKVPAGTVVVTQGAPSPGLCVVLQGEVDVSAKAEIGSVRLKKLEAGDVFGEMSVLSGAVATATVTAVTDCSLLVLPRESITALPPEVRERLAQIAEERRQFNKAFLPEDSAVLV